MKKSVKISTIALALIFGVSFMSIAQEEVKVNRTKKLTFNGESEKTEIKVKSGSEYNFLRFSIAVELTGGQMTVEVIDPEGEKKGSFTVKSEDVIVKGKNTKEESEVTGQMSKSFSNPIKGDWIIRAKPGSATGQLHLNIFQAFEPRIDMIDAGSIK